MRLDSTACEAALRFAARDSTQLVPPDGLVQRYFSRWLRVVEAEPILASRAPQRYRTTDFDALIFTSNPRVIDAWTSGRSTTNDAAFDGVMAELGTAKPTGPFRLGHDNGDGTFYFPVSMDSMCNEERLHARLLVSDAWLVDPLKMRRDDGVWTWERADPDQDPDRDIAHIEFTFGWGDCLAGCSFFHMLRAIVPPDGDATVFDAGGDPLPDYLQLSPNTRPEGG